MHLLAVDPHTTAAASARRWSGRTRTTCVHDGVRLLQVKTLGPSDNDEFYARTTAFYLAMGYLPLEELHDYWPENNPCLILVKAT